MLYKGVNAMLIVVIEREKVLDGNLSKWKQATQSMFCFINRHFINLFHESWIRDYMYK